jgi:hypothetical protein
MANLIFDAGGIDLISEADGLVIGDVLGVPASALKDDAEAAGGASSSAAHRLADPACRKD